jgi:peptide deformylase
MTRRKIIDLTDPILRKKARAVRLAEIPGLQTLIDDMIETMRAEPGVGLAANQVAVGKRLAVIEYAEPLPGDAPPEAVPPKPKSYVLINPEITACSEEMVEGVEGCLSVPGYSGRVLRHESITVKALNRKGQPIKIKPHGWLARIFQHEMDHLDGVLFIDIALEVWQNRREEENEPATSRV